MQQYSFTRGLVDSPPQRDIQRTLMLLPVDRIRPNPQQPRAAFAQDALSELMISIAQVGLIQPLTVRAVDGQYELIAGERRLRACKLLGMKEVPCVIQSADDQGSALMALVENIQRKDLHYLEEAQSYQRLLVQYGITQDALAVRLGKSQAFLSNKLRLLRLSPQVRQMLLDGGLSERHARALLALPDERLRLSALREAVEKKFNVQQMEAHISTMLLKCDTRHTRVIGVLKDYRLFVNGVKMNAEQLRQNGMRVELEETRVDGGVDLLIRVRTAEKARALAAEEGEPPPRER